MKNLRSSTQPSGENSQKFKPLATVSQMTKLRYSEFSGNKSSLENRCMICGWQLGVHAAYEDICPSPSEEIAQEWEKRGFGRSLREPAKENRMGTMILITQLTQLIGGLLVPSVDLAFKLKHLIELDPDLKVSVERLTGEAIQADDQTLQLIADWKKKVGLA